MQKITFTASVLLGFALVICVQNSMAQVIYHNGQLFEKTTVIETTSKVIGPSSTVNMHSNSAINTLYRVTDSSSTGYAFDFTIKDLTADLESGGQKMKYNSNGPVDTSSLIQKGFDAVVGKKIKLAVNKKGIITRVDASGQQAMGGMVAQPVQASIAKFTTGTFFDLNTAIPVTPASKAGDTWSDSSKTATSSQTITYTITSVNNGVASVIFNGLITTRIVDNVSSSVKEMTMKINGDLTINLSNSIVETRTSNCSTTGKIITGGSVLQTLVNSTSKEVLTKR